MAWHRHNIVIRVADDDCDEPWREAYNSHSRTPSGAFLGGYSDPQKWAARLVSEFNERMVPQGYPERRLLEVEVL